MIRMEDFRVCHRLCIGVVKENVCEILIRKDTDENLPSDRWGLSAEGFMPMEESILDAEKRIFEEQMPMPFEKEQLSCLGTFDTRLKDRYEITYVYCYEVPDDFKLTAEDTLGEFQWISLKEIKTMNPDTVSKALDFLSDCLDEAE